MRRCKGRNCRLVFAACASICAIVAAQSARPPASFHFRDVTHEAGLTTVPPAPLEKKYLAEMMGGGVALFDCDNDGMLDILTVNDSDMNRFLAGGDLMVTLYRQDSPLHFTDVTAKSGLTTKGWGMGIAVGDYDNDGLPDIYVTGYGHNVLYRNLGGCKFQDVTEQAHVGGGNFSVGAAWADYDRDGHLDLYVSRYVDSNPHHLPGPGTRGVGYRGLEIEQPVGHDGPPGLLYHNRGDGTFEEVAARSGMSNPDKRLGMGVVWADYDNDGWPDLFVTNDMGPNFLFHNKRNGTFDDLGVSCTVNVGEAGEFLGNMAGDFGDISHDGTLGVLITRYAGQPISIYHNEMAQGFTDNTYTSGLGSVDRKLVRWGAGFADFDNDGWNDILVSNGNFTPLIDSLPTDPRFREPIQIFRSNGNGTWTELSDSSGLNQGTPLQSRRGTAFGDINNDGNVDFVVYNVGAPPSLFLNETKSANHRVLFRLVGTRSNKAAIGARVTVTVPSQTGTTSMMDEVRGGGSYLSSNDQRLHFGLGSAVVMKNVEIRWPSGGIEELKDISADAIYTIVEGQGIRQTVKLPAPGT